MTDRSGSDNDRVAAKFGKMFEAFGKAVGEIFDDPELKKKAKDMANSMSQSADAFAHRFKDEDVKERFKDVGRAAQDFGDGVANYFGVRRPARGSRTESKQGGDAPPPDKEV